jgi:diaminohydroxyphosphoribosylaminopyrimidine deaminase/5-amino-6-(5-phosphoribosylamino)uracil reductase
MPRQPHAVVVDSRLDTPLDAKLFIPGRQLWIYAAVDNAPRRTALEQQGATVTILPGPDGKVDLAAMLVDLARREVNELHIEAGHKLNGSLIRERLVDEYLVYLAPKLLGAGPGHGGIGAPDGPWRRPQHWNFQSVDRIGVDLRIVARPPGRDNF